MTNIPLIDETMFRSYVGISSNIYSYAFAVRLFAIAKSPGPIVAVPSCQHLRCTSASSFDFSAQADTLRVNASITTDTYLYTGMPFGSSVSPCIRLLTLL